MNSMFLIPLLLAGLVSSAAIAGNKPAISPWGLELSYVDKNVRPGDDFFTYCNGGWLKNAKIQPARNEAGSWSEIEEQNEMRLKTIITELLKKHVFTDEEKKIRDLYEAFVDQKSIEANGLKPIEKDLAYISSVKTFEDVARVMGNPRLKGGFSYPGLGPFDSEIGIDGKNSSAYAVFLGQSGLGMPNRDYYLNNDSSMLSAREAYKKYI